MAFYYRTISSFTQSEYDEAFAMMSAERRAAVERMKFENDRKRSVLGEYLARKGIKEMTGIPMSEIKLAREESGKPYCTNAEVHFGISHSHEMVVCIVTPWKAGVDVELIRPVDMRVTKFACTDDDMKYLDEASSDSDRDFRFLTLWTAKEAYVKFHGTGIANMKEFSYNDIRKNCQVLCFNGYIITTYSEIQ